MTRFAANCHRRNRRIARDRGLTLSPRADVSVGIFPDVFGMANRLSGCACRHELYEAADSSVAVTES
jgi:hypothetical protein